MEVVEKVMVLVLLLVLEWLMRVKRVIVVLVMAFARLVIDGDGGDGDIGDGGEIDVDIGGGGKSGDGRGVVAVVVITCAVVFVETPRLSSLSALLLKTAAAACSQVGTRIAAICLICLSGVVGMSFAIFRRANKRAASSLVPWWMI